MPTLTFYVTDDVAMQLEKVIEKQTEKLGFVVSRGDIIVPHIKKLYQREFPKNGKSLELPAANESANAPGEKS
jgi:hypothetical protein